MKKKNIGSSFDSWLREEGTYEEVTATAIKRVLARQVEAAMKEKHFSKAEMARRMHTSRAALDRLLDPDYDAVTLSTLRKAATAEAVNFAWSFGRFWNGKARKIRSTTSHPERMIRPSENSFVVLLQ